jgi:hypothetical protein
MASLLEMAPASAQSSEEDVRYNVNFDGKPLQIRVVCLPKIYFHW